jgi:hypothetical protein
MLIDGAWLRAAECSACKKSWTGEEHDGYMGSYSRMKQPTLRIA